MKTPCLCVFWPTFIISLFLSSFLFLGFGLHQSHANIPVSLFKRYYVREYKGFEILCDPYIVKPNDYVLKILRQKGEIADYDFPLFLEIFKQFNPSIKNINTIIPGQQVVIPLKKILPNTFSEQSSGIVDVPIISLTNTSELLKLHSKTYQVQKGDSISKLIAEQFGNLGTRHYNEGIKMFKSLNPDISNLDLIFIGQKIQVPDATIMKQPWYAAAFPSPSASPPPSKIVLPPQKSSSSPSSTINVDAISDPLHKAAAIMDASVKTKGTYFFPRKGKPDLKLNLAQNPLIEFNDGKRLMIAKSNEFSDNDLSQFKRFWKNMEIVKSNGIPALDSLIESFIQTYSDQSISKVYDFSDQGLLCEIRAPWIYSPKPTALKPSDRDVRKVCLTLIDSTHQKTAPAVIRYLRQNKILVKEVTHFSSSPKASAKETKAISMNSRRVKTLDYNNQRQFVKDTLHLLGFQFFENIEISFSYGQLPVTAASNLISGNGISDVLLDFGNLYGDAVTEIQKMNFTVIQLINSDTPLSILSKLFEGLHRAGFNYVYDQNPSFLCAKRSPQFNIQLSIPGILLSPPAQTNAFQSLFSLAPLNPEIIHFLNTKETDVVLLNINEKLG